MHILFQFNEASEKLIRHYPELTTLNSMIESTGFVRYGSEDVYENLEPWIQWVSFYTGKNFAEHKSFHLGDYQVVDKKDFFNRLKKEGLRFGRKLDLLD